MKNSLIYILFPPQVDPCFIPYQASSLAKRLRQFGYDVRLHDDNISSYAYFLDGERLAAILQGAQEALADRERQVELGGEYEYIYYRTVKALLYGPSLAAHIGRAWEEYRDTTQPPALRARAKQFLQQGLEVASLPFAPTLISLNDLNLRYSTQSTSDIVASVTDLAENPYLAFWQARVSQLRREQPGTILLWIEFDQQLIPAFTLAHLLKESGPALSIILAGPFLRPFSATWTQDGPWRALIDEVVLADDPLADFSWLNRSESENTPSRAEANARNEIWTLERLPLERYLAQPPTVSLTLDPGEILSGESEQTPESIKNLYQRIERLSESTRGLRFSITTPLRPTSLVRLAKLVRTRAPLPAWGSAVSYGSALTPEITRELAEAGCRFLHFELKGYYGYADAETARQQMLNNWQYARKAGLEVLCSVVYGHPLDDCTQFADLIDFLNTHADRSGRIVHFKLFRLYRHSRLWREADRYGLRIIEADQEQRDLQRHFAYISRSGVDSRELAASAAQHIAALRAHSQNLSSRTLLADEWAFAHAPGEQGATAQAPAITLQERQLLSTAPSLTIRYLTYALAELEKRWSGFVAGQPWPSVEKPLAKKPATIVYEAAQDRFLALNETVLKLLEWCRIPTRQEELFARFSANQHPALRNLLQTLIKQGLIIVQDIPT